MKFLSLSLLFAFALSCSGPKAKKDEGTKTEVTEEKKQTTETTETEKNDLLDPTQDLIVVLKNPEHITETKELISNSGLKWEKTLLDKEALKVGLIKIPANKRDFWLDRLIKSGEFKHVKLYSEKALKEIIEKEKKNF